MLSTKYVEQTIHRGRLLLCQGQMSALDSAQSQLCLSDQVNSYPRYSRVPRVTKPFIYLLLTYLLFIGPGILFASAQTANADRKSLQVHPSIQFATELDDGYGATTPAFFNLLSFSGEEGYWKNAQVEIKFPIREKDLLLAKSLKQFTTSSSAQTSEASSIQSMLPKLDYHAVGQLEAINDLDPPIWVLWLPLSSEQLNKPELKAVEQVLSVLRDYAEPESIVYIYQGQLIPKSTNISFRVADFNLTKIKKLRVNDDSDHKEYSQFSLEGFGELLKAVQFQYNSPNDQVLSKSSYKCGRACREMMPTLRVIALNHGELDLKTQIPKRFKALFESIHYPEHFLYKPVLTIVNTAEQSIEKNNLSVPWLKNFSLPSFEKDILDLNFSFVQRIKQIRSHASSMYYLTAPISIPTYFWGQESIEISTRVSQGEESVVQSALLKFAALNNDHLSQKRVEKSTVYQDLLEKARKQFIQPSTRPLITKVLLGLIWLAVVMAIFVIFIRLRKTRTRVTLDHNINIQTEPLINHVNVDQFDKRDSDQQPAEYVDSISQAPRAQDLSPDEYARQKRQERERSLPRKKPSQLSPMVNPEDPSTMPAPAAEAKISDQPQNLMNPNQETSFEPLESIDPNAEIPQLGSHAQFSSLADHAQFSSISSMEASLIASEMDSSEAVTLKSTPILAGLYAEAGPMKRFFFLIRRKVSMVGRDPSNHCDLPPDGTRADRQISRRHFELTLVETDRWEVRCVSSQGITVNQTMLSLGESGTIKDNDLIYLGESTLRFRCSTAWKAHQVKAHLKIIPLQS